MLLYVNSMFVGVDLLGGATASSLLPTDSWIKVFVLTVTRGHFGVQGYYFSQIASFGPALLGRWIVAFVAQL